MTKIRAEVDGRDLRLCNRRFRRIRHPAGDGGICGLRPQRTGKQREEENQQESGDFVHTKLSVPSLLRYALRILKEPRFTAPKMKPPNVCQAAHPTGLHDRHRASM